MYPNSFNGKSKTLLKTLVENENKINYKNLSDKYFLMINIKKLVF